MSICIHCLDLWYSHLVQNTADSLGHVRLTQSLSADATIGNIRLVKTCLLSFLSMETVAIIETCPFFLILHRLAFLWICILTDVREYDTPTQYFYLTAHNKPRPHILYSLRKYSLPVRTAYDRCSSRRILLYRTKPCSHNIFKLIKIT